MTVEHPVRRLLRAANKLLQRPAGRWGRWTAAVLAAACAAQTAGAAEFDFERLAAERARWQAVQTADYRFGYQKLCVCYPDGPPITLVTVRDGRVSQVDKRQGESSTQLELDEASLAAYWTVDDLFDKLEAAAENGAVVRADYHPEFGYPTSLFVDYDADWAGDETDLRSIEVELR